MQHAKLATSHAILYCIPVAKSRVIVVFSHHVPICRVRRLSRGRGGGAGAAPVVRVSTPPGEGGKAAPLSGAPALFFFRGIFPENIVFLSVCRPFRLGHEAARDETTHPPKMDLQIPSRPVPSPHLTSPRDVLRCCVPPDGARKRVG